VAKASTASPERTALAWQRTALTSIMLLLPLLVVATRVGAWWLLAAVMGLVHFLGSPVSFDTVFALLAGWFSGAAVVVVLGAPSRRPTKAAVAEGLARVGVALAELDAADVDARGSTPYFGADTDGTRLFVKVLGADERSADLLFRLYRRLLPRDLGDERSFSSLRRAVEHEALVALVAGQYGVRTPRLVAFAAAAPNGFVLAYEALRFLVIKLWRTAKAGRDRNRADFEGYPR